MTVYQQSFDPGDGVMRLRLLRAFNETHWDQIFTDYRKAIEGGRIRWEIDLRELELVTSMFIGMLIALSTSVRANAGELSIIVRESSPVANQLRFARVDRVLDCRFV